jgi:ribosomal-protein-alanine N-acetyltransferase
VIVPLTTAHLDGLMTYEHEMFGPEAWSRQSYASEIADTALRHYLAAESDDGELLGWGGVMVVGPTAEILTIGVVPQARRRGLATELLHALLTEARRRDAEECLLEVREDNDAARAFYHREGFEQVRVRRGYYDHGRVHAIEMRSDLGGAT